MVGALALLLVVVAASRFYPTLNRVETIGNRHYSAAEVMTLANTEPGDPFFWIIKSRVAKLVQDPWIESARVYRHWPDTVAITVVERQPAVTVDGAVYALDGTLLPNAAEAEQDGLVTITGWGEDRVEEAFELLRQLADYQPKMLSYSPAGFTIQLATTEVFTPSVDALRANWASFLSQQGTRVAVYPWGVSAAHD